MKLVPLHIIYYVLSLAPPEIAAPSCPSNPPVPAAGRVRRVEYGGSVVTRYSCVAGYHLVGRDEVFCSGDDIDDDDPVCATDVARAGGAVSVRQSSGIFPEKVIDGSEEKEHRGK